MAGIAQAITVTPDGSAASLITALTKPGSGLTITSLTIGGQSLGSGQYSWGTYTNPSGTYLIGPGMVISSGDVADYSDGPNTSGSNSTDYGVAATLAQAAILTAISGPKSYYDVTEIDLTFDMDALHDTLYFNVTFGTDEYAEFIGTQYIDAFGMLVNGINVAFTGGLPVNVDHPAMAAKPGTELDGVLAPGGIPVVQFSKNVGFGSTGNTLKFIIADSGDGIYDATAYIAAVGGTVTPPIPEPASVVLLATAFGALAYFNRKRLSGLAR